jgi:FkbM family methyltransferase
MNRWPANRFGGMHDALTLLRRQGFRPEIVIDCGANVGQWYRLARSVFLEAFFHLTEPQLVCAAPLHELARVHARTRVRPVAVTEPGVTEVRMIACGAGAGGGTGAWVARPGEAAVGEVVCGATTLDALLAAETEAWQRPLFKLDLEGHGLSALQGAPRLLEAVEVVLPEFQFYEINSNGRPTFGGVMDVLEASGFPLYDFACRSPRPRDQRLRMGDAVFVRRGGPLIADEGWK